MRSFRQIALPVLSFLVIGLLGAALPALSAPASVSMAPVADPPGRPRQAPPKPAPTSPTPVDLTSLLAKTAAYCAKLEASAFDFVCREEIRETIDPKLDAAAKTAAASPNTATNMSPDALLFLGPSIVVRTVRKIRRSFVYDYQCVRAGRAIRETRTLIEENGKKKDVPNATLDTSIVVWGTALLGPCGLFGERFQKDYDYAIAGRETLGGVLAVIVEAKPKPGAPPTRNLYGRAWIDPAAGDILKIKWSESRVGNFDAFAQRGRAFDRTPRLTIVSEFSAEKNGLRFPTHLSIEEAYLKESRKPFVRSTTDVAYKDFKFFTVTVEVR